MEAVDSRPSTDSYLLDRQDLGLDPWIGHPENSEREGQMEAPVAASS
jgi:hypothetical protein